MGGFGFGVSRMVARRGHRPDASSAQVPYIRPASAFTGVAGSGFASLPADPVRTTAKPALRLITPPRRTILGETMVGVAAWANDHGSLMETCGIEKVIMHYEGNSVEITEPSWQAMVDANGTERAYFGWWMKLSHNGAHGQAQLYIEAVPRDPSMQRRVIGPYLYLPSPTRYDFELTVAPSQPEIDGARYKTVVSALTYLKNAGAQRGHVTIVEGGAYQIGTVVGGYAGSAGYCTIDAAVPVAFGIDSYTSDTENIFRPKYDGLHFRGGNITFDFRNVAEIRQEDDVDHFYWMDGINFTVSGAGRAEMWRKGRRPIAWVVRNGAWFTECDISGVSNPCFNSHLVRGCHFHEGHNDCVSESRCVIGNTVDDWDSVAAGLHVDVPAMIVTYKGSQPTATLSLSAQSDNTTRVLTARWGASSAQFTIGSTQAYYNAQTAYNVADVVAWINTTLKAIDDGWSASLLDDSRRATALSLPGLKGANFPETDVSDTSLTLVTEFDSHTDWYAQINPGNVKENAVIQDNRILNFRGQGLFLAGDDGAKDYVVVNNAWFHKLAEDGYAANSTTASQLAWSHSHVVVAHNSWASQKFNFKSDAGYSGDEFCLVANNTARAINWVGTVDLDVRVNGNHLQDGSAEPINAHGTTIGGKEKTLFAGANTGDFAPAGALLDNLKPSLVRYDRRAKVRESMGPVGAIA